MLSMCTPGYDPVFSTMTPQWLKSGICRGFFFCPYATVAATSPLLSPCLRYPNHASGLSNSFLLSDGGERRIPPWLYSFAYSFQGVTREETLNSTLFEMHKANVLGFGCTPGFRMKSTHVFVHEAPRATWNYDGTRANPWRQWCFRQGSVGIMHLDTKSKWFRTGSRTQQRCPADLRVIQI